MSPAVPQRFTFDDVAELYDRVRPRYPAALVEDLVSVAGIASDARILELGCGTGQLTVALARRGLRMLCLEPGPNLARVARRNLAGLPAVEIVSETFEACPLETGAFDLVVSAQAFHWLAPEVRFAKAARVLRAGGSLAVLGHAVVFQESPVRSAIDAAYAERAPSLSGAPATRWYAEEGPIRALFEESGLFGPVAWRCHPWSHAYTDSEWVDLLRTSSDHRVLPEPTREALLAAVGDAIRVHGGRFEVRYEAHLYVGRRSTLE